MVLIVTLNPSIDLLYFEEQFALGAHNRFKDSTVMAAGKGINCARALSCLGENALALTTVAGLNGDYFKQLVKEEHFTPHYISLEGQTRHAITIMHDGGVHTEIVETGPKVDEEAKKQIFQTILSLVEAQQIKIISLNGSVHSDEPFFYNELIDYLREKTAPDTIILTDFSRQALDAIMNHSHNKPDFIKPNLEEFSELAGQSFSSKEEIIPYLRDHPSPIPYTLVSCGKEGAVAQFHGKLYDVTAPTIQLVNPTGSGDSTVAGAIYAFKHRLSDEDFLRYAIASGTANAMETGVGVIDPEKLTTLLKEVHIQEL